MKLKNIHTGVIYKQEDIILESGKLWIKGCNHPFPHNHFELVEHIA